MQTHDSKPAPKLAIPSRRTFLKGAVLASSAPITIGIAAYDPILTVLNDYRDGWRLFCAAPDEEAGELHHLWREPHNILADWNSGCTTRAGALAALRVALEEEESGDSPVTAPMMRAALDYFESQAS